MDGPCRNDAGHPSNPAEIAMTVERISVPPPTPHASEQHESEIMERARRRAFWGHVTTAGFTVAATVIAFRRGRAIGFKKLFNSVSAPKDFVYIGFLYGAGDVSQQLVTQARRYMPLINLRWSLQWKWISIAFVKNHFFVHRTLREPVEERKWDLSVDWPGVGTVTLVGCAIFGPINHYWYTFLDKLIVGTSFKNVVKKVIVDQLSLPIPIMVFFTAMSIMRAKPDILEELKVRLFWKFQTFFPRMLIVRCPMTFTNHFPYSKSF